MKFIRILPLLFISLIVILTTTFVIADAPVVGFGGTRINLKTTFDGTRHVPHVNLDASSGSAFQLAPTIVVQNAAYSAGNSEGGLLTISGAARSAGGSGTIMSLRLKSTGASTNTVWVYVWSKTPAATCTDKAAYVASASDNAFLLPGFPTSITLGGAPGAWDTATYAQLAAINAAFKNQDSTPGTNLYVCLVTAGAVTPASTSDLSFVLGGLQD